MTFFSSTHFDMEPRSLLSRRTWKKGAAKPPSAAFLFFPSSNSLFRAPLRPPPSFYLFLPSPPLISPPPSPDIRVRHTSSKGLSNVGAGCRGDGDCGAISGGGDGSHGRGRRCLTATINYPQEGPASLEEKREKAQTCQVKKEAQKFCRETARKSLLVGERNWRNLILRLIYFLFLAPNERAWWVGEKGGGCWREEA